MADVKAPYDKTDEWESRTNKPFAYSHADEPEEPVPASSPLRPVLADFALAMEYKLRKNDHKMGWRNLPIEAIFKLLMLEIEEFKVAHEFLGTVECRKELVDVANFAMILWDRLSHEEETSVPK